jgi:adenosine deaminase
MTVDDLKDSGTRWRALRRPRRVVATAFLFILAAAAALLAADWDAAVTRASFAQARTHPTELRAFLQHMPKGADLHAHLSGAVYAERYIEWAAADGLCWRKTALTIVRTCDAAQGDIAVAEAAKDQATYDDIVNAFSMRAFLPTPDEPTAHDHFFATFGRFSAATYTRFADMLADQLDAYAAQSVQYAELMATFLTSDERRKIAAAIKAGPDYDALIAALNSGDKERSDAALGTMLRGAEKGGLASVVGDMQARFAAGLKDIAATLACDSPRPRPGCRVSWNLIAQISRNTPIEEVFAQTAAAAALIRKQPRLVAFNFVQPEDYAIARRDYRAHMRIVGFLARPPSGDEPVNVALHAGELWIGLVPPDDLTFHIGDAVEVAGAKRIGHGVDLAFENNRDRLLENMRRKQIAVEINLTSNDQILGVRGREHPFQAYRAAGVPVVLSTDDAGVERIDLTHEYARAARDYGLSYAAMKELARASLVHSFARGDKDALLKQLGEKSDSFEKSIAGKKSFFENLWLIAKFIWRP